MTTTNNVIQFGKDNQPIIDALKKVEEVALKLCNQGFRIIDVYVKNRNPRIIINPAKRCAKLGGTMIKRTRLQNCLVFTFVANIDGVQVEWMVPDHG
ncbi:hypothetical protein [Nitrosomonas oligotropha]|uniref:hypothetical protein n=1 Tax=Nitrosomonas oligotropha TaxID=42354 RepID=UPI00136FB91D|nr:hypothetical protein [Nitrosomonas oligotropha]MXS82244.1 hypothetical protein [Nitrosomonas oligotropha]